jgi:osmoprotectant transport system ATP-binding protein
MIEFKDVSKAYGKTPILQELNFTIPDGQFVVLVGPSGCGKTTTLKTINRLIEPDTGPSVLTGRISKVTDKVELRRHIGYVIQQIGLFPNMTVAENISVVPKLMHYDAKEAAADRADLLKLVQMEAVCG